MRVLAALGGNALLHRGEPAEADIQRGRVREAAQALARIAVDHELVVTHGNGPQVGLLALQSEAYGEVDPYPFDVLVAESEGMIGYLLEQELRNALPDRTVATLLTQIIVSADDPAFARPEKPIGPVYSDARARVLSAQRGWATARDGEGWRRVVASPEPREIVALPAIRTLLDAGTLVVCAGGGGIPAARDGAGALHGVEAVIDKDLTAALLGAELEVDVLLLLTDVDAIQLDFGTSSQRPLTRTTPDALDALSLAPGSMAPKAAAAARFVRRGRGRAAIGALTDAAGLLTGTAGTQVVGHRAAELITHPEEDPSCLTRT